jgi:hypothetical protein
VNAVSAAFVVEKTSVPESVTGVAVERLSS